MNTSTKMYIGERVRGNRHTSAITEAQFKLAHILASRDFDNGVTMHTAIRDLRVVEIYVMPMASLEQFNQMRNETPEVFA